MLTSNYSVDELGNVRCSMAKAEWFAYHAQQHASAITLMIHILTDIVSKLLGALSPVNHRGLHQGYTDSARAITKYQTIEF